MFNMLCEEGLWAAMATNDFLTEICIARQFTQKVDNDRPEIGLSQENQKKNRKTAD